MRASYSCSTLSTSLSRGAVACACLGSWVPSVLGPNLCVFLSAFGGSPFVALPSARSLPQPRGTVPHSHVVAGGVLPTPSGNAYFADAMAASDEHTLSTAEHSDPFVPVSNGTETSRTSTALSSKSAGTTSTLAYSNSSSNIAPLRFQMGE